MSTLSSELRAVIEGRLKAASTREILAIATTLCAQENGAAAASDRFRAAAEADAAERFFEYQDAVYDKLTGLEWTKSNVGEKPLKWADAKAAAEAVRIGGHTDWRLPTVRELLTLVDYERHNPAINPVFKCDSAWYWTSTVAASSPSGCAWLVNFSHGSSSWASRSDGYPVRAVRAGQIVGTLA